MSKQRKKIIERTEGDDILDALSLRVNETLKTEKKIDDKKNNVYFWLFKLILLLVYLVVINLLLNAIEDFGVALIYYVGVSLRSVMSSLFRMSVNFSQGLVTLYILFKNLKIFMNSSYYKRLYSKDKEMNSKKKVMFNAISNVFKVLAVPFMFFSAFFAALALLLLTLFGYLLINGIYSVSAILIAACLFVICYFLFKSIQSKFFDIPTVIRRNHFAVTFLCLLISIILFRYEIGSYDYNNSLPDNFNLEYKEILFDINDLEKIAIKSNSKYENISVYTDDTLDDTVRIELEYFNTARVSYTNYFNDNNNLILKFNSTLNFELDNFNDVLKLGVETLRSQTLYNYNLFKYPSIKIYVSKDNFGKISILNYSKSINSMFED